MTFSASGTNAAKNCTATFQAVGDYTLAVTVQDVPGLTVVSQVKVRVVQSASSLTLNPAAATLAVNAAQTFTVTVLDQFNQSMASPITWSANGGGTISTSGVFTATTAVGSPFVVSASSAGLSDTSGVTVTRAFASVSLSNLSQTYDGSPKPVSVSTTPTVQGVSVLYAGSSTPPTNTGSYSVSASVVDPNYQGTASGTLVIAADEWKLWENTYFTAPEQAAGLATDLADPDADGFSNLAEYALGVNPRLFTAPLNGLMDTGGFSITFTRPANLPGIHYAAEASGNLSAWSPVPLEIVIPGAVETVRARDPFGVNSTAHRALRLRFERD